MNEIISCLQELKKKWRTITIVTLVFVLASLIFTRFFIENEYKATTKIFLGKQKFKNASEEYTNEEIQLYERLVTTYSEFIKTRRLINASINQSEINLNRTENIATFNTVINNLSVAPITNTQLIELKYKSYDGQEAYDLMYAITENLIAYSKVLYPTVNIKVLEQVDVNANNLAKKKITIILLGLFLGLSLSCGYEILRKYLKNTYTDKESLDKKGIPVLGIIPEVEL